MNTVFAFVCALSAGQVDPSVLDPQFPRVTREWVDSTGEFRVTAKLVGVTKTGVLLEKENEKTITVPLTRLDKTSREVAGQAYPHFLVEQKIHDFLRGQVEAIEGQQKIPMFGNQGHLGVGARDQHRPIFQSLAQFQQRVD